MVDTRALPLISNETYLYIFDFLELSSETALVGCKKHWCKLACVCRLFYAHFVGKIYEELVFDAREGSAGPLEDITPKSDTRLSEDGGQGLFSRSTLLRSRVQTCTFRNWQDLDSHGWLRRPLQDLLGLCRTGITRMANLSTLRLEFTSINEKLVSALLLCNQLTHLEIDRSSFDTGECMVQLATKTHTALLLGQLPITHIRVLSTPAPPEVATLFWAAMSQWKHLTHFHAANAFLDISNLLATPNRHQLRTVILTHINDPKGFANFLESCTQLERLEVTSHSQDFKSDFRLSSSAVPHLAHLHSTSSIARALARGRSITHLHLCIIGSPETQSTDDEPLDSQSSGPFLESHSSRRSVQFLEGAHSLQSLRLSYDSYIECGVKSMVFPALVDLTLDLNAELSAYPTSSADIPDSDATPLQRPLFSLIRAFIDEQLPSSHNQLRSLVFHLRPTVRLPLGIKRYIRNQRSMVSTLHSGPFPALVDASLEGTVRLSWLPERKVWVSGNQASWAYSKSKAW